MNQFTYKGLEKMQQKRIIRLLDIAYGIGRGRVTNYNLLIKENVQRAQYENNESDAEYQSLNI